MPEIRHELILRLPNLTGTQVDRLETVLAPLARRMEGARLSRITREHHRDHALHVERRRVV